MDDDSKTLPSEREPGAGVQRSEALRYAKLGWHIFPCRDKRPLTPNGFKDASTDAGQVERWWGEYPEAEIGWVPGWSGHVVIDLDVPKNGGGDGRDAFARIAGPNPVDTPLTASTPSGGQHLVFRSPVDRRYGTANLKKLGIDVRGHDGYVILPDGRPDRKWVKGAPFDTKAGDAPAWLVEWLDERVRSANERGAPRPPAAMAPVGSVSDDRFAEVRSALFAIKATCGRDPWLRLIYAVHDALRGDARGAALVEEWSSKAPPYSKQGGQYLRSEASRIYAVAGNSASRLFGGENAVSAGTLFKMARENGWQPPLRELEVVFESNSPADEVEDEAEPAEDEGEQPPDALRLRDWTEVADLPMVSWLVRGLLPERSMALLAGDTMMGKSFVAIDIAMRLVHDLPFFGRKAKPTSVLYLCGEGQEGLAARFRAWRQQHRLEEASAANRYCLISNRIPELNAESAKQLRRILTRIRRRKGHAPGLVVVDTLSQALDGDENDAGVTAPVLRALARLRDEFGCTILVVHHIVKRDQRMEFDRNGKQRWFPVTLNAVRGSGAITRNIDTVLGVQTLKDAREVFELVVLKQKDGSLGGAIRFQRRIVNTGLVDEDSEPETSCVLETTANFPVGSQEDRQKAEQDLLRQAEDQRIDRLIEALRRERRFTARDTLVRAAGMKLTDGRVALDLALGRRRIIDLGKEKRSLFVLPEDEKAARRDPRAWRDGLFDGGVGDTPDPLGGRRTDSDPSASRAS